MIKTVSTDQKVILRDIIDLHNHGEPFDIDVTYGRGKFYGGVVPEPIIKLDLYPVAEDIMEADVRNLPFVDDTFDSIVFDPPFIHAPGKDSIIGQRFGGYKSQSEIAAMYAYAVQEIHRVLRTGGILVFKCHDIVESGRQVWNHIRVFDYATEFGFVADDLFILVRDKQIVGHNHSKQQHARKAHSYFWVFRKERKAWG